MEWLEDAIKRGDIKSYDYTEFSASNQIIGDGGFGVVYKSEWENRGLTIALKKLKNIPLNGEEIIKGFVKELKYLQRVYKHQNVIEFYGVTRDISGGLHMVLQFANNGNLREYLKSNFSKLEWIDKLRIACEISDGLKFLHENNIIHRDLHSKNILVHEEKMLIADFGLSKDETSKTSNSEVHGMTAYIDPKCFECFECCENKSYKRSKKSDIYSFGVILWEISSGRPPFQSVKISGGAVVRDFAILMQIKKGTREKPIEGTPNSYVQLYKRCWDYTPDLRPTIEEISENLSNLYSQQTTHLIINYSKISDFLVNTDNEDESNDDASSKDDGTIDSSKDDKVVDNMLKIPKAIQPSIGLNDEVIQIPTKHIDELWNFFVKYFLNTGLFFQARDVVGCEQCGEFGPFIQILFNLSCDLYYISFFFFTL
ncbi:kinase-like domain-containing protein [Gigaspora rosea]|uniref:Kinase-like domain-containing protein n=1 Tax=Gigaspora rosea TaxID=44941 RepID=A0A397WAE2_9GLOM|nr:kinase-like domain-containing protein [Gigaspora rosea]